MTQSASPSHTRYSPFRCEEAVITNVDRKRYTVTAETTYSSKTVENIQCGSPYVHHTNGEGEHHLPEVGATCYLAWPNDSTPPFIMCYVMQPTVTVEGENGISRSGMTDSEGSTSDINYKGKRPDLNPGDWSVTGRDGNFIFLRRGGVVQIGATSIAQRLYLPILNYIKDFCENYEMSTLGGELSWTVDRQEYDPSGKAPVSWILSLREFAQDPKATVRIRHMPLQAPGGQAKSAWEVHVAPQGINLEDGSVENVNYSLVVSLSGSKSEVVGADRTVTIRGNDVLRVQGNRVATVDGNDTLSVGGNMTHTARGVATMSGRLVKMGSENAAHPSMLGDEFVQWFASGQWIVTTTPAGQFATPSPAMIVAMSRLLSRKVLLE